MEVLPPIEEGMKQLIIVLLILPIAVYLAYRIIKWYWKGE